MSALGERIRGARAFLEECWVEVRKVTWPTRTETRGGTIAVTVFVAIAATYLWLLDFAFSTGVNWVLR